MPGSSGQKIEAMLVKDIAKIVKKTVSESRSTIDDLEEQLCNFIMNKNYTEKTK